MARVVVLGAGLAGLPAAHRLARRLGREHSVTVVAREADFVYRPSLPWVAVGVRRPEAIVAPVRPGLERRGIRFVQAEVRAIDPERREVVTGAGVLRYDFLIVALGAELDWEAVPGSREHSAAIHRLDGCVRVRDAIRRLEAGRILVVIAPGVDTPAPAYEFPFLLDDYLRRHRRRRHVEIEIATFEPRALDCGGDGPSRLVTRALEQRGIRLRTSVRAVRVEKSAVVFDDGTRSEASLIILDPPYRGPSPLHRSPIADAAGFVRCNLRMHNPDYPEVFAAGDCVALDVPRTGHHARLQASVVARNVAARVAGREPRAVFRPSTMLDVPLGSREAVFSLWKPSPPALGPWQVQITHLGRAPLWLKHALERYILWELR